MNEEREKRKRGRDKKEQRQSFRFSASRKTCLYRHTGRFPTGGSRNPACFESPAFGRASIEKISEPIIEANFRNKRDFGQILSFRDISLSHDNGEIGRIGVSLQSPFLSRLLIPRRIVKIVVSPTFLSSLSFFPCVCFVSSFFFSTKVKDCSLFVCTATVNCVYFPRRDGNGGDLHGRNRGGETSS